MQSQDEVVKQFIESIHAGMLTAHNISKSKGWWESDRNDGEMIALMHSELSEALEGIRHNNPPSDYIPEFNAVEEELADVLIRVFDMCQARGYRLPEAVIAKMEFNARWLSRHLPAPQNRSSRSSDLQGTHRLS